MAAALNARILDTAELKYGDPVRRQLVHLAACDCVTVAVHAKSAGLLRQQNVVSIAKLCV